jgi:hypothetical protein
MMSGFGKELSKGEKRAPGYKNGGDNANGRVEKFAMKSSRQNVVLCFE